MPVGTFPGLQNVKVIPQPKNPLDKCTLVSLMPKVIHEYKPTIFPGHFHLDAAKEGDFTILVIGSSSWWKEMEEGQPFLEIPNSSVQMAESVIADYCNGIFGCNMTDRMPGIFYVPGEYDKKSIFLAPGFADKLAEARKKQRAWYAELVKLADVMWAQSEGNPLAISDDARYGAQLLGLSKPWMQDFQAVQLVNCKACGELTNPAYPVCKHCHAVTDPEKAKALGITFAGK